MDQSVTFRKLIYRKSFKNVLLLKVLKIQLFMKESDGTKVKISQL